MSMTTGNKNDRRFFAMRLAAKVLLALLFITSYATSLRAQTIQFKVVNGITGRPVASVCVSAVDVWWKNIREPVFIRTDKKGVAQLRLTHKDDEVDISYNLKLY